MIYKDQFNNDFEEFTTKLNLIQFTALVSSIFDIKDLSINCKKSGYYKLKEITLPEINNSTLEWVRKLFTIKYDSRFELDSWCKEIK